MELLKEIGQTDFAEVVFTEPLALAPATPLGIEQALAQRIEIKVARAALEQSKANVRLQDVSARPDLNITYGYKRTQLPDTAAGVNTAIVSLRVTLPTTDKNQGNRIAAEADVRRQQQLLAAAEAEVRKMRSLVANPLIDGQADFAGDRPRVSHSPQQDCFRVS